MIIRCEKCRCTITLSSSTNDGRRRELRGHGWMDTVPRPGVVGGVCPSHVPAQSTTMGATSAPLREAPRMAGAERLVGYNAPARAPLPIPVNENAGPERDEEDVEERPRLK